ncbi:MAG: radical SAM protein [bacterium]
MYNRNYIFDGHKLIYHLDRVAQYLKEKDCFPLYMEISPVGRCNHRCIFCAYDFIGYPDRKLETEIFLKFIDDSAHDGIRSLLYAGEGEPLLHPDIDQFITHSKKRGIDVGLYTNGQLLTKELSEKILPSLTFMRISFNGGIEENYSIIHRVNPSIFHRVLHHIETAVMIKKEKKLDLDIGIQYVLLPENINYVTSAVKSLKERGVDYFVIKPFIQQSSFQHYQMKEHFQLKSIDVVLKEAENFSNEDFKVIARRDSFDHYGIRRYKNCLGSSFITVLNSAGELASCLPYWDKEEFVFGNIYEKRLKEIWCGERRRRVKEYLERDLDTHQCPPNCRPHAINEFLWEVTHPSVRHINFI